MQLLQITSTPMKYELEVEHAKLEHQQDFTPVAKISTTRPRIIMQSQNAEVQIDTYEARKSLGIQKIGDFIEERSQEGEDHINQKTREYVQIGKEMGNIQNDVKISDIFRQKMIQHPQLYTAFLPRGGADISWNPAQLSMNVDLGETQLDWEITENMLSYVPGSVHMKILEYAKINIEYLGGPIYVPPSADPEYVPIEG